MSLALEYAQARHRRRNPHAGGPNMLAYHQADAIDMKYLHRGHFTPDGRTVILHDNSVAHRIAGQGKWVEVTRQ